VDEQENFDGNFFVGQQRICVSLFSEYPKSSDEREHFDGSEEDGTGKSEDISSDGSWVRNITVPNNIPNLVGWFKFMPRVLCRCGPDLRFYWTECYITESMLDRSKKKVPSNHPI